MKHTRFVSLFFLFVPLFLASCSVEIAQTSAVSTAVPATATSTPLPTLTPTATDPPPTLRPGETAVPTVEPTATLVPVDWNGFAYLDPGILDFEVLPGWQDLGLSGSVLFLSQTSEGQSVVVFEFATGRFVPIFLTPKNTWVLSISASPDKGALLISYAPVPPEGETQYGYTDLYLLHPDSEPEPLLERTDPLESYFGAFFSNSGESVIYSWFLSDKSVDYGFRYHINRLDPVSGASTTLVEDAFWETLSRDETLMAYVTLDPDASFDAPAELKVMSMDDFSARAVLDTDRFPTVDSPFFSPDGKYLYFSAISGSPSELSWLDRLFGVQLASAHNVPSDWWRVNLETEEVERVSEIFDQGMFGVFSPEGNKIAFISSTGLWVMNPDGSGMVQVLSSKSFYGNVEWVK